MTENTETMLDHLEHLLDRYGADETVWPTDERKQLEHFLKNSQEAQARLHREKKFEATLQTMEIDKAPAGLFGRVLKDANQITASANTPRGWFLHYLKPLSSLAFAASLGFIIGVINPELLQSEDDLYFTENTLTEAISEWGLENDNG